MSVAPEHRFKIDVFTPETLPMERLAEYMSKFAKFLGEQDRVHFVAVERGSVVLVARAEAEVAQEVERQLLAFKQGSAQPAAVKAWQDLDDMLATDNAVGQLLDASGAERIAFPGRTRPKPLEFGPFREDGVLEGIIIRVGGKDGSVPIWLKDGATIHKCTASVQLSKELSEHYQGALLRVRGSGRWMRLPNGEWKMLAFDIKDFEVLDSLPLAELVKQLQAIPGADWGADSARDLWKLRNGGDAH